MAKATPKKATAKVTPEKEEAPKVEAVKKEEPKVEEPKKEEPKVEVPKVETPEPVPAKDSKEESVRVRVLKDFENIFIGGKRYSGKSGTQINLPSSVAFILRHDGSII